MIGHSMSEEQQSNFNVADGPIYLPDEATQQRRNRVRRIITIMGVIVWFVVLLIPLCFFILAANGEITIGHGNIPERESHPRLKVDLISEIDYRGFGITRSIFIKGTDNLNACVETHIDYLLWEGEGEPAIYCECYSRTAVDEEWQFTETITASCP